MTRYPVETIEAATAGDEAALEALLKLAQPDIQRYARRSCKHTSDVEDAVQETLFVLYRHIGALRSTAALSSWLFTAVHRFCLGLAKRLVTLDFSGIEPQRLFRTAEPPSYALRIDVASAIQSLPPHYREVVILRDLEEMTMHEIATKIGDTKDAVKARLRRARALLREYLEKE